MAISVRRSLLCALLALALLPAAARADDELPAVPVPAADALMTTAHQLAVNRWGMDPCGGQVTVTWAHMGAGINAQSRWMSTDVRDPSTYSSCSITYNLDVDWDWPKLCTVVEHELGHLSGHDHVNDPHDVMSPYYVYPTAECAAGTAALTPAPAPAPAVTTTVATSTKKATRKSAKKSTKKAKQSAAARARAAKARAAKARAAKARAAKARAAKARAAKARAAKARAAKARAAKARASKSRAAKAGTRAVARAAFTIA
jgi:hypothetical protein